MDEGYILIQISIIHSPQFTSISMEKRKIPGKAFHPAEIRPKEKDDRLPHGVQSGQLPYEPRRIPESDLHFVLLT